MDDLCSDVLIVGAGVIGLSIARELRKRGAGTIRVLDKGQPGREASWAAAGILAPQVEATSDGDFFRLCLESNRMYSDLAAQLRDETGIDVEYSGDGVVCVGFDEEDACEFDGLYRWQSAADLSVERLDGRSLRSLEPEVNDSAECGLFFPDNGHVNNRRLMEALVAFAAANDIVISSNVSVESIRRVGGNFSLTTSIGTRSAEMVVIATGAWTSLIKLGETPVPIEVKPIRGQMIAFDAPGAASHVIYSKRGYVVPRRDGQLLVGATVEDVGFDKSTTDDAKSLLRDVGCEIIPLLKDLTVTESWAGLRPFIEGGEPFIGAVAGHEDLFAAVGHFRNGILLAPITAKMIADQICK